MHFLSDPCMASPLKPCYNPCELEKLLWGRLMWLEADCEIVTGLEALVSVSQKKNHGGEQDWRSLAQTPQGAVRHVSLPNCF